MASVFAHQGGWDEALLVLVPIGLFVGLLWLANRRARALQAKRLAEQNENENENENNSPGQAGSPTLKTES